MKHRYRFLRIAGSSLCFILSFARAAEHTPFEKYLITFDNIQTPNFGRVNCILRDDRGFIWFGTSKALCKYDGYRVWVFPNGTPLTGPHQIISAMVKLDADSLLLGTGTGLQVFNLRTEQYSMVLTGTNFSDHRVNA